MCRSEKGAPQEGTAGKENSTPRPGYRTPEPGAPPRLSTSTRIVEVISLTGFHVNKFQIINPGHPPVVTFRFICFHPFSIPSQNAFIPYVIHSHASSPLQ